MPVSFTRSLPHAPAAHRPAEVSRSARAGDHSRDQCPCQAASPRAGARRLHCGIERPRATKHFSDVWLELTASAFFARLFGKALEHLPQYARACHSLAGIEPPRPAGPLKPHTFRSAADASPAPVAIVDASR